MDRDVKPWESTMKAFTAEQRQVLAALERVGGTLSLFGVILIFITFYLFKRIRTVPNTFILFASIANVGASIASIIGLDGIEAGETSALCQTQAFLFEMFMQSDPWWSFAMAINVWMVFFLSTSPTSFRRHLWIYCLICFGIPAVPAFVCLFLHPNGRPIYGDAILWCWINHDWNSLRIYSYYLPIWVCILLSAFIYIAVGYQVFHQRNQLRNLTLSNQAKETSSCDVRDSAEKNLTSNAGYYGTVTTEVQVTSNACCDTAQSLTPPPTPSAAFPSSPTAAMPCYHPWSSSNNYAIDEELGNSSSAAAGASSPTMPCGPSCPNATFGNINAGGSKYGGGGSGSGSGSGSGGRGHGISPTTSILAGPSPPKYHTASVISSGPPPTATRRPTRPAALSRVQSSGRRIAAKLRHMDPVKLAYLRTSFVFAISVLVTWTPSSINRVYNLVYPETASYGLNIASAAVLPLQGVWNAAIYFSTSWKIMREELEALCFRSRWLRRLAAGTRLDGSGLAGRGRRDVLGRAGGAAGPGGFGSPTSPTAGGGAVDGFDRAAAGVDMGGRVSRTVSADVELSPRVSSPRVGTVRVQRGGELDLSP